MTEELETLLRIKNGDSVKQEQEFLEKYPSDVFQGFFPIRILINNITEQYNTLSKTARIDLKRLTEELLLDKTFFYSTCDEKLITPFVNYRLGNAQMQLAESFVAFTWCVAYYFILNYEKLVREIHNIDDEFNISDLMMGRANELFDWAMSLKTCAQIPWPDNYPNPYPTARLVDSEAIYCLKTNCVAVRVICFCMYHELGHVALNHFEQGKSVGLEQEADNYAFDCILDDMKSENQTGNSLALIIGTGELLFLCNSARDVHSSTHPDIHRRMSNALQKIQDYLDDYFEKEFKTMEIVLYSAFFKQFGLKIDETIKYDSLDCCIEAFESVLDTLD